MGESTKESTTAQMLELMQQLQVIADASISDASSPDDLKAIITETVLQYPHHTVNVEVALKIVLEHKITTQPWASSRKRTEMLHALNETLEAGLTVEEKSTFFSIVSIIESLGTIIDPIINIGADSEARANRTIREGERLEILNKWVEHYDEQIYGDLPKYLKFIEETTPNNPLTEERLKKFFSALSNSQPSAFNQLVLGTRRRAAAYIGGMVMKEADESVEINKGQQKQVTLLKKLINQVKTGNVDQSLIDKTQAEMFKQQEKQRTREANRASAILKSMFHGKLSINEAMRKMAKTAIHPYQKIITDENSTPLKRAGKLAKTIVVKSSQPVRMIGQTAAESAQSLVRNTWKQPVASITKTSLVAFNVGEYLLASAAAIAEADTEKKAELMQLAQSKLTNAEYNSIQALAAIIATAATATVITATVASAGGTVAMVPLAFGVKAVLFEKALEVVHMTHNVCDGVEILAKVSEAVINASTHRSTIELIEQYEQKGGQDWSTREPVASVVTPEPVTALNEEHISEPPVEATPTTDNAAPVVTHLTNYKEKLETIIHSDDATDQEEQNEEHIPESPVEATPTTDNAAPVVTHITNYKEKLETIIHSDDATDQEEQNEDDIHSGQSE